jgi:hypothetical protein
MLFDWDPHTDQIAYTTSFEDSDWIVLLYLDIDTMNECWAYIQRHGVIGEKKVIVLNVFHLYEHMYDWFFDEPRDAPTTKFLREMVKQNNLVFIDHSLHTRDTTDTLPNDVLFYDLCWHRHIVYFCEYTAHDLRDRLYTYDATQAMYTLNPIEKNVTAKHYLAIMRTYEISDELYVPYRTLARRLLREVLDPTKGYIGDQSNGIVIDAQEMTPRITDVLFSQGGGTFWPAHNRYYEDSIVSIYGETCVRTTGYRAITEKTWDPLIKGNFILPYGYSGLIKDIKSYGFLLPDWIDYSYDDIPDDPVIPNDGRESRLYQYFASVKKLLDMNQSTLYDLYKRDKYILEHNRALFFSVKRESLLEKIKANFSSRHDIIT